MDSQVMQLRALRDNEFAIQVSGDGVPLIWGHCLLGSMEADDAAGILDFEQLTRHVHLIRFDARGHGARLGWLLDPLEKRVYVYGPDHEVERLDNPTSLDGADVLIGFVLDLREIL